MCYIDEYEPDCYDDDNSCPSCGLEGTNGELCDICQDEYDKYLQSQDEEKNW